jgi:MFS family permease
MEAVSQGWLVWDKSHSTAWTGLLGFAALLPMGVLALPMGVVADRFNRRKLLLLLQILMCAGAALQALACHLGWTEPWMTVSIAFLEGLAAGAQGPVWHSLVPELVPREDLGNAIALNSAQFNTARAIGPVLAGAVVSWWGLPAAFDLNVVSFALVIVALVVAKPNESPRKPDTRGLEALTDGLKLVRNHPGLFRLIWGGCVAVFFSAPIFVLLQAIADDRLGGGVNTYAFLLGAVGLGAVIGAMFIGWVSSRTTRQQAIALAGMLLAFTLCGVASTQILGVVLGLLVLFGIGWSLLFTTQNTALQMLAPDAARGRIMSVNVLVWGAAAPLGQAFFGWIARPERLEVTGALFFLGAGALAIAAFQLLSVVPAIEGASLPEAEALLVEA